MIKTSINLSPSHRLDLKLVKKRKNIDNDPLLPSLGEIRRIRKGNKISRFFRHVFENDKARKLFGANLAFMVFASTLIPQNHPFSDEVQETTVTSAPTIFETRAGTQYPTDEIKITQGYRFYHPGIDFDGITGDEVKPIMGGVITGVDYSKVGYGNAVLVNHGSGIASLYAHLSKIDVEVNENVTIDTKIGEMGATGRAFGDHLHLEVYENGKPINPLTILP